MDYKITTKFYSKSYDHTAAELFALKLKQDMKWLTDDYLPTYLEPFLSSDEVRLGINCHGMVHAIFENGETTGRFINNLVNGENNA